MACCIETAELARVRTMCLTKRTLRMNMTKKEKELFNRLFIHLASSSVCWDLFLYHLFYIPLFELFEWDGFQKKFCYLNNYKNLFCDANF